MSYFPLCKTRDDRVEGGVHQRGLEPENLCDRLGKVGVHADDGRAVRSDELVGRISRVEGDRQAALRLDRLPGRWQRWRSRWTGSGSRRAGRARSCRRPSWQLLDELLLHAAASTAIAQIATTGALLRNPLSQHVPTSTRHRVLAGYRVPEMRLFPVVVLTRLYTGSGGVRRPLYGLSA